MKLFKPNTDFYSDTNDKGKFVLAWRISLSFIILFLILIAITMVQKPLSAISAPAYVSISITLISLLTLKYLKTYKITFWIYIICISFLVHVSLNSLENSRHFVDFIWLISSILLGFIGLGKRYGLSLVIANLFGLAYFYFSTLENRVEGTVVIKNDGLVGDFIEIVFAILIITYLMYQFVTFYTIVEKEHKKAHEKNEHLINEVHDRVNNNLKIINSFLNFDKQNLKTIINKQSILDSINRIEIMSYIDNELYKDQLLSSINMKSYIEELHGRVLSKFSLKIPVVINVDSEIKNIGLKTVLPLGLIINEILSNSLTHAFSNKEAVIINFSINIKRGNQFELIYFDNGCWENKNDTILGLGIELIEKMTNELQGTLKKDLSLNGTSYEFILTNEDIQT